MAFYDFNFDPTATSAANKVINEIHTVNVEEDRSVFPTHGAFYDNNHGLVVEGRTGTGDWEKFKPNIDFNFSPILLQAAAKTGKEVVT